MYSMLKKALQVLIGKGYNVVYIGYYGAHNYNLADDKSDFDFKAIVIPTLPGLIKREVISTVIECGFGNIDVKDLITFTTNMNKGNFSYIESLKTSNCIDLGEPLLGISIQELFKDVKVNWMSMVGAIYEKRKALTHEYPSKIEEFKKWGCDCYREDTLFLTNNGFKHYDDINDNDLLATCNPENLNLEYQHFTSRIKKHYSGNLLYCNLHNTSFCVTPTHNLFLHRISFESKAPYNRIPYLVGSNWILQPYEDHLKQSLNNFYISFPYNAMPDLNISNDELILTGLYVSEGSKYGSGIRITQTSKGKDEFFNTIRSIKTLPLQERQYNHYYKDRYIEETQWGLYGDIAKKLISICGTKAKDKKLPPYYNKLSKRQAIVLLNSLMLGDGYLHNINSPSKDTYYTCSKELAYQVLLLASLAGKHATLLGPYENPKNIIKNTPMYYINIKTKELKPHSISLRSSISQVRFEGDVVCFEVPNGTLVTSLNGKLAVQGNCKQFMQAIRLFDLLRDMSKDPDNYNQAYKTYNNDGIQFELVEFESEASSRRYEFTRQDMIDMKRKLIMPLDETIRIFDYIQIKARELLPKDYKFTPLDYTDRVIDLLIEYYKKELKS